MPVTNNGTTATGPFAVFTDIAARVNAELTLEGNTITTALTYQLANDALDAISVHCRPLRKVWLLSDLTADADGYLLPADVLGSIQSITYDGDIVSPVTAEEFERLDIDGDADMVYTTAGGHLQIAVDDTTLVRIEGKTYLPHFDATNPPDPDPLTYLPQIARNLPAYYILMMFPSAPDVAREQARVERNRALWTDGLTKTAEAIAARASERWRF